MSTPKTDNDTTGFVIPKIGETIRVWLVCVDNPSTGPYTFYVKRMDERIENMLYNELVYITAIVPLRMVRCA